jgi:hypothetical protein
MNRLTRRFATVALLAVPAFLLAEAPPGKQAGKAGGGTLRGR